MYSTCITCGASLGGNEVLEAFPVGRRLAFDARRGRLWVLCSSCRAWNLAPLEERWEAVESAERLFEHATVGSSTENVALGRLADGTELLRIGRVDRPEMAAWRYGYRLLGRWRRQKRQLWVAGGIGAAVGFVPFLGSAPLWPVMAGWGAVELLRLRRPVMRTRDGRLVRRSDAIGARLLPAATPEGWRVSLPRRRADPLELTGEDALRALRGLLPRINGWGGRPEQVRHTVSEVERLGSAARVLRESAIELADMENMSRNYRWMAKPGKIATGHPVIQLALEMAVNEEAERRALEGELHLLEREWREAEELAAIADELLLPRSVHERIRRWKQHRVRREDPEPRG